MVKVMVIAVNVFAILSAALFYFKKISPYAFLMSSSLWFIMMILYWFLMPILVTQATQAFKDRFRAILGEEEFAIEMREGRAGGHGRNSVTGWKAPIFSLYLTAGRSSLYQKKHLMRKK
jgi:hypothetical protein